MEASRDTVLPLLVHLSKRPGVRIVGTQSWDKVDVLVFGTSRDFVSRFPLLVFWTGAGEPRFPLDADEYNRALLPSGRALRKHWHTLSVWKEPSMALIRWDLSPRRFTWYARAVEEQGVLAFGRGRSTTTRAPVAQAAGDGRMDDVTTNGTAAAAPPPHTCDFVVRGIQNPCQCLIFACVVCKAAPTTVGAAVYVPGRGPTAWHPCPHAGDIPRPAPVRAPADSGAAAAASEPPAPASNTPSAATPAASSAQAIQVAAEAPSPDASDSSATDAADEGADGLESVSSGPPVRPTAAADGELTCGTQPLAVSTASAVRPPAPLEREQSRAGAGYPPAASGVDGGPRSSHAEDAVPGVAAGPLPGMPEMPVSLWQLPLPIDLSGNAGIVEKLLELVPEPPADRPILEWSSLRRWELDDTSVSTTTQSCIIELEHPSVKAAASAVERAIAGALKCDWDDDIQLTEARLQRHCALNAWSAKQNLARRSGDASSSRHLCARVVLILSPGVRIEHRSSLDDVIELRVGEGLVWWNIIGACPWWGHDVLGEVSSVAACGSATEPSPISVERRFAVELWLFWTRLCRQGRLPGIGTAGKIGLGRMAVGDVLASAALFGSGNADKVEPMGEGIRPDSSESAPLRYIWKNLDRFTSTTHFAVPLVKDREYQRFNLTVRPSAPLKHRVSWPLKVRPEVGDVLVHFASVAGTEVSMYVKKPIPVQPPRRMKRTRSGAPAPDVDVVPSSESDNNDAPIEIPAPSRRRSGRLAAATPVGSGRVGRASTRRTPSQHAAVCPAAPSPINWHDDPPFPLEAPSPRGRASGRLTDGPPATIGEIADAFAKVVAAAPMAAPAPAPVSSTTTADAERIARLEAELAAAEKTIAALSEKLDAANSAAEAARAEARAANEHIRQQAAFAPSYQAQLLGMTSAAIIRAGGHEMQFPGIPTAPPPLHFPGAPPVQTKP